MKKRIACLVLVLVMLVGMIPAAAVSVSAESGATSVSEAGIRVIKNYIGFHKTAYEVSTGVYKIGYGTDGVANQTITESNADKLLRDELDALSQTIAASFPNLVQKRFDALVWYSYVEGSTAWMSNSTLVSEINSQTSASALADAMCSWDYDQSGYPDDTTALSVLTRRMIIANLYLNGGYSATSTGSLGYTVFYAGDDANAAFSNGAKKMVQVFAASSVKINVSDPSLSGSDFLGWYSGSAMVTGVGSSTSGKTLTARWQANGVEKTAANYTLPAYVIYEARDLSDTDVVEVYDSYTTLTKIDEINRDSTITVVAETIYNNAKWLQLSTGGWVKLCDDLSSVPTIISATTVTITDDYVNIREDPSATSTKVGTLTRNTQVTIAMLSEDGKWGYCSEGWIFLAYTSYDTSGTASSTLSGGVSGTVSGASKVNVRASAGVGNTLVTQLAEGTAVTVYEQTTVDGAAWGHIDQGWISMSYVTLNETTQTGSSVTTGSSAVVSSSVNLNVRSGPGTSYTKVATLAPGTSVVILRKQTVNGVSWGLIDQGWINLNYVSTVASSSTGSTYGVEGTVVNCSTGVNIRSAAGTSNALVGVAALGSRVTVTERVLVNGYYWGHISNGWVCMEYIQLDSEFVDQTTETEELDNVVTSFQGYPAVIEADTPVLESASATASTLLTLKAGAEVDILAMTTSGSQMYGKVTVGTVTGWVDMDDVTLYQFNARVTSSKADAYELPSTRSTFYASLTKGTYVTIGSGSGTDGWALTDGVLWGRTQLTDGGATAWIKLSDVTMFKGNVLPTGITTLSGVGYLTGTVTSDAIVYKDSSDTDEGGSGNVTTEASSYTLTTGSAVNVLARNYNSSTGKTYAKVTVGSVTGWIEWDLIELDPVEMQVTTATTIYGSSTVIPVGTMITITSRSLAYVGGTSGDAEINYGVIDVGTGYVGDDLSATVQVQLDNGKLTPTGTATSNSSSNPAIASSVVVSGTANGELSVYEEAIAGSNVLLKVSSGSIVTILNWKNVDGITWGKVQVNKIVGWVKVSDVSFDGLTGTVNVDSLSVYYTKDKTSAVQILRVNNRSIELSDISFDGTTVWAKMDIDGINGYIDLSNVTLNTPTEESDTNYLTTIAKGKVNSVDATANMDSNTVKSLTKGTEVELAAVKVENGEALWRVKLGSEAGWIKMDCLSMYTTIATITQASASIYNDLNLIEDDILYTLYRNETITVLSYRVKDGSLYGEVAYGSTTGWILLCEGETMYVSLTPGSTGTTIGTSSSSTSTTTATEATTASSTAGYIVCSTTVNVRSSAGIATNNLVTTLANGTNVNIYETTTVNGKEWARIDQGWVCMDYVRYGTLTTTANGGTSGGSGTVAIVTTVPSGAIAVGYANQDITVRSGYGMGYASVGTVAKNNSVTIYEIKLDGGMSWGRTDTGWICVSYLTITAIGTSPSGTVTGVGFTANVRYTASSSAALMAKVMITSKVDVLETATVGTETWVRTSLGWINAQYVTQDAATIAAIDASTTTGTTSSTTATTSGVEEVG